MTPRHELRLVTALTVGVLLALVTLSCSRRPAPQASVTEPMPSGEPERYSAVVEQRLEDGAGVKMIVTRLARTPDWQRQEWDEGGERLALISRPDLGKSFLLHLDKRLYIESESSGRAPASPAQTQTKEAKAQEIARDSGETATSSGFSSIAGFADDVFEEEPEASEVRALSDERVDDYLCAVTERRATFAGGRVEVLKVYRAVSLGGLMVRTEAETVTPTHRTKVTTTRRDITLEVMDSEFEVPAGFRKVQKLP